MWLRWTSAALAGVVYLLTWVAWVHEWRWVATVDGAALGWAHRMGVEHHGWVTFWDLWCTVLSPAAFRIVTLGLIGHALVRRRMRIAVFLFVGVELSAVLTEVAKGLADRPRPSTAMVDALSTSFPSGHALGTMVAVLALGTLLRLRLGRGLPAWAVIAGLVIVATVGAGRVALDVHHPSDVVAGWALGYLYFVACLLILPGARITAADETPAALDTGR